MVVTAPSLAPETLHNMSIASRSCSLTGTHANSGLLNREQHKMMINQDSDQVVTPIDSEEVTAALTAILTTDKFSASPQMSAFLKYVVEQTLIGNTRRIRHSLSASRHWESPPVSILRPIHPYEYWRSACAHLWTPTT